MTIRVNMPTKHTFFCTIPDQGLEREVQAWDAQEAAEQAVQGWEQEESRCPVASGACSVTVQVGEQWFEVRGEMIASYDATPCAAPPVGDGEEGTDQG